MCGVGTNDNTNDDEDGAVCAFMNKSWAAAAAAADFASRANGQHLISYGRSYGSDCDACHWSKCDKRSTVNASGLPPSQCAS
jgi:hypothetical protein